MIDPGHFLRKALSLLPPGFVSVDEAARAAPREFASIDHLSIEAVAAYVDGELPMKAHLRAAGHLAQCGHCAGEVAAQGQAREALRDSRPVTMPSTLLGLLSQIPQSAPQDPEPSPEPVADPGVEPAKGIRRPRRKRR